MPLRSLVPDIPVRVEKVVLKALEKKPERRFKSVQAFVFALNDAYMTSLNKDKRLATNAKALQEMMLSLIAYLFIAATPAAIAYLSGVGTHTSWFLFALCILILPATGAVIQRGRMVLLTVFPALVVSALVGVLLHSLFIAGLTQFALLDACAFYMCMKLAQVTQKTNKTSTQIPYR